MGNTPDPDLASQIADDWLAAELERLWLLAERAVRNLQRAQLRPPPNHPLSVEVEALFAARRGSRAIVSELELAAALDAIGAQVHELRARAPIGRVASTLGLRDHELEALVIAIAPHIDAAIVPVFHMIKGPTPGKRGVDLDLVAALLRVSRVSRVQLLDVLSSERPLVRWHLLEVQGGDSFEAFSSATHRALRPAEGAIALLCGRSDAPARAAATFDDLRCDAALRRELDDVCAVLAGERAPWLAVWGPAGIGKRTIAARIAASAGRALLAFDALAVERAQFDDAFARAQRDALVHGAMLYVGPLCGAILENGGREIVRRLAAFPGPVVLGIESTAAPRLVVDRPLRELELRMPPEPVRSQLWHEAVPSDVRGSDLSLASIARAFQLTPGEITSAAAEARAVAAGPVSHAVVRAGVERRLRNELADLARRIPPTGSWSDLVLPSHDMARIDELISRKRFADVVYRSWGYGERIGYGKGLIALFSGPPGTGKTMLASLIAQALDLDLYQIDMALVMSRWVGETEKQLAKLFDQAERAHAVLLFDEADSLFAKRTEVTGANDRFSNGTVNYLLQRLERYTGVAVLTTNKEASLDEALQRRLSLHLRLDIPEAEERERLWQSFLPAAAPIRPGIDLGLLASEFELSGGYIKNAAVRAAFLAASANAPIDMEILRLASALELEDMGRVVQNRGGDA